MNSELYHWGLKKGEERKNHKYSKRELIGTKNGKNIYRYFYGIKDKIQNSLKQKSSNQKKVGSDKKESKKGNVSLLVPIPLPKKVRNALNKLSKKVVNTLVNSELCKKGINALAKRYADKYKEENKKYKYVAKVETPNGTRYFYDKKELEAYYAKNGTFTEKTLMKRYGLKQDPNYQINDMNVINEHYKSGALQYGENCYSCSLAYDLRRRGFDVEAVPDTDGLDYDSVLDCYKGGKENTYTNGTAMSPGTASRAVAKCMKDQGDDSHGIIMVYWRGGNSGGHAMAWEVNNGKAYIRDCQTNDTYDEAQFERLFKYTCIDEGWTNAISIIRTDNLELDPSVLKYVQKNTHNQYTGTVAR